MTQNNCKQLKPTNLPTVSNPVWNGPLPSSRRPLSLVPPSTKSVEHLNEDFVNDGPHIGWVNTSSAISLSFSSAITSEATERRAPRAAAGHLGQRAGLPRGGGAGVPQDACDGVEAGEPVGYSPDFNADQAIWGWAREERHWQSVPWDQGGSAGKSRSNLGRSGQPE